MIRYWGWSVTGDVNVPLYIAELVIKEGTFSLFVYMYRENINPFLLNTHTVMVFISFVCVNTSIDRWSLFLWTWYTIHTFDTKLWGASSFFLYNLSLLRVCQIYIYIVSGNYSVDKAFSLLTLSQWPYRWMAPSSPLLPSRRTAVFNTCISY